MSFANNVRQNRRRRRRLDFFFAFSEGQTSFRGRLIGGAGILMGVQIIGCTGFNGGAKQVFFIDGGASTPVHPRNVRPCVFDSGHVRNRIRISNHVESDQRSETV